MMLKTLSLTMGLLAATTAAASAASVYGTDVDSGSWQGSRSGSGQVVVGNVAPNQDLTDMSVSWDIEHKLDGNWHYEYTFSNTNKNLSHILLEFSSDATSANIWNLTGGTLTSGDPQLYTPSGQGNSDPNLPADLFGIKISGTTMTIQIAFDSDRSPVWGNFYAKGGQGYAYNAGMAIAGFDSDDVLKFIARPDGAVPEPASVVMGGIALAAVVGATRLRRGRHA